MTLMTLALLILRIKMNNTARVFRELRERWSDLSSMHKPDEKVAVGLRFASGEVRRAEATFEQLPELLTMCFDWKHPSTEDLRSSDNLLSLFICDSTGNPFYDSNDYRPSKIKVNLRKDGDRRVLRFANSSEEDKEQIVSLTVEQIHGHIDEVGPEDDLSKKQDVDNPWGDMPW
jgi:hypothetical protein